MAESMLLWCELVNKEFGTHVKMQDLDSWASWKKFSISKDDFYRILDESWENWEQIPPTEARIADKVAMVEKLGDVDIVTGRSRRTEYAAKSWVENQNIRYRQFVRVDGWRDKAILDYDIYIDDAPDLMPVVSGIPLRWAVLYDRPWNCNVRNMPKVFRVKKWREIPLVLKRIQRNLAE